MRVEPSGMTNDPDIRAAKSIVDWLAGTDVGHDQPSARHSVHGTASREDPDNLRGGVKSKDAGVSIQCRLATQMRIQHA
jgi:hypothetical protein